MPISIAPLNGQSSSKKGTFDDKRYNKALDGIKLLAINPPEGLKHYASFFSHTALSKRGNREINPEC
jgi:hypothetical protein